MAAPKGRCQGPPGMDQAHGRPIAGLKPHGRIALQLLLLLLIVAGAPAAAAAAKVGGPACARGCPAAVSPVCGADGVSYMSACVAACSGRVGVRSSGYCPGDRVRFAAAAPPAAAKERALGGGGGGAANVSAESMHAFAAAGWRFLGTAPLSHAPLFRKVPRPPKEAAAAPPGEGSSASSSDRARATFDAIASYENAGGSAKLRAAPNKVDILRGDRQGRVYYKTYTYNPSASSTFEYPPRFPPGESAPAAGTGPATEAARMTAAAKSPPTATGTRTPGLFNARGARRESSPSSTPAARERGASPGMAARLVAAAASRLGIARAGSSGSSSGGGGSGGVRPLLRRRLTSHAPAMRSEAAAADDAPSGGGGAALHRMLSVIGEDSRVPCGIMRFPYGAMGQLSATAADGTFLCSGALIAPDRILTAAHCVWDDRVAQSFFADLAFKPSQWRSASGAVATPEGRVEWEHVTVFKAYVDDPDEAPGLHYDVAVVKLASPIGLRLGWLGVAAADAASCSPNGAPLRVTLSGYPGDDPWNPKDDKFVGGCFTDQCTITLKCSDVMTSHSCDSYIGQSGAPMYDANYYVRLVHTLGVLPGVTTENSGVTLTKFLLDNIMVEWPRVDTASMTPRGGR